MAHVLSGGELTTQRLPGQWSRTFLAIPEYHVIYTALLNGVPALNDKVGVITFDGGSGTLANVLADMTLLVGTTAETPFDLGICRIRKAPIAGTFYIGIMSNIIWVDNCFLTVVDDFSIWQKSIRVVSEIPYMDYDITYSNQHTNFDPVCNMGGHRVKRLVGASVAVKLGPAADTPSWVHGSTISSRAWTCVGATFDNAALTNPTATFSAAGTYLAYCTVTAANGKTFKGVRYVIIYDDDTPLIEAFTFSNGRGSYDSGGYKFDVTLFTGFQASLIRSRSMVILCTEDFADNDAVEMPGQIEDAENIVCMGWIADIDNSRTSQFGEITFTVESAEYWLKQIRDYPSGLELKVGTATAWTDMPSMTVDRALWHFLHWRSSATRVMDITLTSDTRLKTRFQTTNANLWERLVAVSEPNIFAAPHIDNFGRLFVEIEPQMVPLDARTWPVVMSLADDDIEDGIQWIRRDVKPLSMLFLSGINVNASGGASSYFSMSPGHAYEHHGEEENQDNYLVASQANSNELCGLYFGWKNNPLDNLEIHFTHSMRALGMFPRQYFYFDMDAADDPRGIGYAGNLIAREISFSQDPDTGFIRYSTIFEPESFEGIAVDGDVPTMESIDFSVPNLSSLQLPPPLPELPYIVLPPTEVNPNHPRKVVIVDESIYQYGVLYTENFDAAPADVVWKTMNNGLTVTERSEIGKLLVTPSGAIYIMCEVQPTSASPTNGYKKIMVADGLGGTWRQLFDFNEYAIEGTSLLNAIFGIGVNPTVQNEIAIFGGRSWSWSTDGIKGTFYFSTSDKNNFTTPVVIQTQVHGSYSEILYTNGGWSILSTKGTGIQQSVRSPVFWKVVAFAITTTILPLTTSGGSSERYGGSAGSQDRVWAWDNGGVAGYDEIVSLVKTNKTGIDMYGKQGMAMSPTGTHAMGSNASAVPYKTTDSGVTWTAVSGIIPTGSDVWVNCGDDNRWIYGGGSVISLTVDQGGAYVSKIGNLLTIAALVDIGLIKYIE